jgi:hypothetical protein
MLLRWTRLGCALLLSGCTGAPERLEATRQPELPLPDALPFELARPPSGAAPSAAEIAAFTAKLTGLWSRADYLRWAWRHAHGLHASFDPSMPDYALFWQDTVAVRAGDTVTYRHTGFADNLMIRTPKMLTQAVAMHLCAGDPVARDLVVGYDKGVVALFQGMVWGSESSPVESIMARAIFTHDHGFELDGGRKAWVDYGSVKVAKEDWNAHTVPNPLNPYFGDIWVRNMRSKDDVPHIFRVVPLLMRAHADTTDDEVRRHAGRALEHLAAFAKDIVDSGYRIRSKEHGEIFVPPKDLASFVDYVDLIPDAECDGRLTSALIGYGEPLGNDCGKGTGSLYEEIATAAHYYNYAIIQYFHLAAITNALVRRHDAIAHAHLLGLIERVESLAANEEARAAEPAWDADLASLLVASAASGLPLTGAEARLVHEAYAAAADFYEAWPHWDLWEASIQDGEYAYLPPDKDAGGRRYVPIEEMAYAMEYCCSPWRNPSGTAFVDCSVVLDPKRWGT